VAECFSQPERSPLWVGYGSVAPHKFIPRLSSLGSSIPSTVLHSSLSLTPCLSPDGAEGDTVVDSNPIRKLKPIISLTISKDKTEGEHA
jgi:hypothetical protein